MLSYMPNPSGLTPGFGFVQPSYGLGPSTIMDDTSTINAFAHSSNAILNAWQGVTWVAPYSTFVAVGFSGAQRVARSPTGATWTGVTVTASLWRSVTYAANQNRLVAVGTNAAMTSDDGGVTWIDRTIPTGPWVKVRYGNGMFVATATSGTDRIVSSPDGITWTSRSTTATGSCIAWSDVAGLFVIPSANVNGIIFTSPDGITWTTRTLSLANNTWSGACWSQRLGQYIVVSSDGTNRAATSPDGITWTARTPPTRAYIDVIDAPELNKVLLLAQNAVSGGVQTVTTFGLADYQGLVPPGAAQTWQTITWSPQLRTAVIVSSATGHIARSVNISNQLGAWTGAAASDNSSAWKAVVWGNGKYVAVAETGTTHRAMYSANGITWSHGDGVAELLGNWEAVCYSPQRDEYVAVANAGVTQAMTSPDGITWTAQVIAAQAWHGVIWAPSLSLYIAVSTDGVSRVATSPDGVTWTLRTAAAANSWNSIDWDATNTRAVAVASDGVSRVQYSANGTAWTAATAAEASAWRGVIRAPALSQWWACGTTSTNRAQSSTDGITWAAKFVGTGDYYSLAYSPERACIVIVSRDSHLVASYDGGATWVGMACSETAQWYSTAYSPSLQRFVSVASTGTNRVMYST